MPVLDAPSSRIASRLSSVLGLRYSTHEAGGLSTRWKPPNGARSFLPVLLVSLLAIPLAHGGSQRPAPARKKTSSSSPLLSGPHVRAKKDATVYWRPAAVRPRRALVEEGSVIVLSDERKKAGAGCRSDWVAVAGGGYLCMDDFEPTRDRVHTVPALIDDILPFTYVHRLDTIAFSYAYLPGEGAQHKQLFRGGRLLDESRYTLHTPSRFHGRDLERNPVNGRDLVPGWTVTADVPVYAKPSAAEKPVSRLARHTPLLVGRRPAAPGWREVRDADGRRRLGFMKDDATLRHWVGAAPVEGLAEGETWLDIDVGQQMLAMRTFGTGPVYVTLVSSGLTDRPSPLGVFRLEHKLAYRSMGNFPHSRDKYFIENVPWTMYFLPEYAIHGAYWHDEFGNRRSHGCVNLAPRDARYIYDRLPPLHQPGFFKTFASDYAPGAVVRLRDSAGSRLAGEDNVPVRSAS
jgi:hypothetical protein